jgi:hypothetical protein
VVVAAGLPLAVVVVVHSVLGELPWSEEATPLPVAAPCSFSDTIAHGVLSLLIFEFCEQCDFVYRNVAEVIKTWFMGSFMLAGAL